MDITSATYLGKRGHSPPLSSGALLSARNAEASRRSESAAV
ncbi:hypothetical protein R80B4_01399 [Fibrobacteres bacterium R8-0-B4]